MNGHHLILGKLVDYISGDTIVDTHDERYRQALAKLLVDEKGYHKSDVVSRRKLTIRAGDKCAQIQIDFSILVEETIVMIIRYGPGSLVTRHRPTLAASRIMTTYQIPIVVVTNGRDAHVLDGQTGHIISNGIDTIPSKETILGLYPSDNLRPIEPDRVEMEQRILYAYDVDDSCPCDDTICRL